MAYKFSPKTTEMFDWESRYIFLSDYNKSSVYNNSGKIFTFESNKTIYNKTYYYINNEWIKEFEYKFKTNNLGLAQELGPIHKQVSQ